MINLKDYEPKVKTQQDFKGKTPVWDKLCNFLLVVRAIEFFIGEEFSLQETLDGLEDLQALKIISTKGGLHKPESYPGMIAYFGKLRGKSLTGHQVGAIRDDIPFAWDGTEGPKFNFVQLKWKTSLGNQHWTLGDEAYPFRELYDAWDGPIAKFGPEKRYLLNIREV